MTFPSLAITEMPEIKGRAFLFAPKKIMISPIDTAGGRNGER
jgi:hypothetical protein